MSGFPVDVPKTEVTSTAWHDCRMSYTFSKGRCDFLIAPSVNVQFKWTYKGAP